ncbi:MAG TPA: malonyl-CoA decarboxylase, partial [Roseateles sp.]|nr:malonyl-CoA decarboxylase [Roseateles sp.]
DDGKATFFERLARDFSPDPDAVLRGAQAYAHQPGADTLVRLTQLAEPPRQELLRRINRSPGGTSSIVAMRRALLARVSRQPELQALEADFLHLLSSWFNPGFLQLQRVDWNSPAQLLEQIIQHEAVHEIDGWDDLRRRLQPDRRCFAFFHPQLPAEPLIFVEVALLPRLNGNAELRALEADMLHLLSSWFNPGFLQMKRVDWNAPAQLLEQIIRHEAVHEIDGWDDLRRRLQPDRRLFAFFHPQLPEEPLIFVEVALLPEMPGAIAPLIDKKAETMPADKYKVAVFYSISNCEPGLKGVSLGNFLIKRVAEHLQREIPKLKTFCTLSPIPGFAAWLARTELAELPGLKKAQLERARAARALLQEACGGEWPKLSQADILNKLDEAQQQALLRLAAVYLIGQTATPQGDPVARFHLDNGARLERLNPLGNRGAKGLKQSCGLMVNYLYDLGKIEGHHEAFIQGEIAYSRGVAALL